MNTKGTRNDVSRELKAFLDYVAGKKTEDAYVEELDRALEDARNNREWRHEYMTLLMRDQENQEIGEKNGVVKERRRIMIKMLRQGFNNEQIMTLCDISKEEIEKCKKEL